MSMDGLLRLFPKTTATMNLVFGDWAAGANPTDVAQRLNSHIAAMCANLAADSGCPWGIRADASAAANNKDLTNSPGASAILESKYLPLGLALLFALAAAATLVHVLVTSIRRRRRDVAILKTLGFNRRQVLVTIEWQASLLALVAALFGVPLGVLIGRWGWAFFADRLGVGVAIVVPWVQVLLILPVVVALAMLIALGPAFAARRTKAAVVLRTE
jgi:ABC-type antimicrobial peptide transport system permease subunit